MRAPIMIMSQATTKINNTGNAMMNKTKRIIARKK
jgi:hypothetical protein